MIIVWLLSPERSWLVVSHQSLLGYRSRHCHGINYTHWEFQASASRAAKIVGQLPASGCARVNIFGDHHSDIICRGVVPCQQKPLTLWRVHPRAGFERRVEYGRE